MNKETIIRDKIRGCLLWGAYGDALGYPVEFLKRTEIIRQYGKYGISELQLDPKSGKALISDDTQMTLFTADALRVFPTHVTDPALFYAWYKRWFLTQTRTYESVSKDMPKVFAGEEYGIMEQKRLYANRAPGNTCLYALSRPLFEGGIGTPDHPINDSKGCGGVMRVAPCGLVSKSEKQAFWSGVTAAAITHGHPTGFIAAGAFAALVFHLMDTRYSGRKYLRGMVYLTCRLITDLPGARETETALQNALILANHKSVSHHRAIKQLGEGWTAAEALAIAVYCALVTDNPVDAIRLAVNHDGDSDSTGAICGNLVGVMYPQAMLNRRILDTIELSEYIRSTVARGLYKAREVNHSYTDE